MRVALLVALFLVVAALSVAETKVSTEMRRWLGGGYWISAPDYGFSRVFKFGTHTDVDDTEVSVWEGDNFPGVTTGRPRCPALETSFTLNISSDDAGDTETIVVDGLDANWDAQSKTVTLNGLAFTRVGDVLNWMRVNRAYNAGSTDLAGVVYLHTDAVDAAAADGIPDDPPNQTHGIINAGENQTLQACYTVPDGWEAYATEMNVSNLGTAASNAMTFRLRTLVPGGVARVQLLHALSTDGDTLPLAFNPPLPYPARTFLEITAITDSGSANGDASGTFNLSLFPVK